MSENAPRPGKAVSTVSQNKEVSREHSFPNPGIPPHQHRQADHNADAAKRAEVQVIALFILSVLGSIFFIVAYFIYTPGETMASLRASTLAIGAGLFVSLFGIGAAAVHWAKTLMPDVEQTDERHPQAGDAETQDEAGQQLLVGIEETQVARRPLIKWTAIGSIALLPLLLVPVLGTLGPLPGDKLRHTAWKKGTRLARDPVGTPIKASDVTIGSIFHVMPEGINEMDHRIEERAKAGTMIVRLAPADIKPAPGREDWSYEGILAYSKVCTHVGCPVALYEQRTHHLLCPCHQSTFDVTDGAKVIFGPASRPLPQLPITVDSEGYLVARSDYTEPVGPSFWEIRR